MSMQSPAQVADDCEMMAVASLDQGDRITSELFMSHAHAIRRSLKALHLLRECTRQAYFLNTDVSKLAPEIARVLDGYKPPKT